MKRRSMIVLSAVPALVLGTMALVAPAAQAAAPSNDDFAHATALSGVTPTAAGNDAEATVEADEPAASGDDAPTASVWYRWTAPLTLPFDAALTGGGGDADSGPNSVVAVWAGTSKSTLKLAGYSGITANNTDGVLNDAPFAARAGVTYYIQVATEGDPGAAFTLKLRQGSFGGTMTIPTGADPDDYGVEVGSIDLFGSLFLGGSEEPTIHPGDVSISAATQTGSYALGPLNASERYILAAIASSGSDADTGPFFYTNTTNILRATQLAGPPVGCSYVGANIDFVTRKFSTPRLTCPLSPACTTAKASAPSPAALAAARAKAAKATKAVQKAKKKLKKAQRAHASSVKKLKKQVTKKQKAAAGAKGSLARLTLAQKAVTTACKPV
jgi:hypothetical protein